MTKNRIPTMNRGTSTRTKTAVLDRHFPPRKKTEPEDRRILPVSKEVARTSPSDRLPDLLHEAPKKAPSQETSKPRSSNANGKTNGVSKKTATGKVPATEKKAARTPPTPPTPESNHGFLSCPMPRTDETPLVRQSIPATLCEERQAKGYHKCGTCSFAKGRQFKGQGLPPLENSPAHLQHTRLLGLFGPDGSWLRP